MELTGILVGVLVAGWLLYLIPWFANQGGGLETETPESESLDSVIIVRHGGENAEVSTPQMRRQLLEQIRNLDRKAARRRRLVLLLLLLTILGVSAASAFALIPWWVTAFPAALLVLFLGIARVTVTSMRADFRRRIAAIDIDDEEDTVCLDLSAEESVILEAPAETSTSLWDAIPITKPTYVSKPVGPRTVRTINLGAPVPTVAAAEDDNRAVG